MNQGEIELRSGTWTWREQEVIDVATQRVETRHIFFRLRDDPESMMRLKAPGDTTFEQDLLPIAARHPFVRELHTVDGALWTFRSVSRPAIAMAVPSDFEHPPYEVVFTSDRGGLGSGALPPGCGLGDATDDELRDLVPAGG